MAYYTNWQCLLSGDFSYTLTSLMTIFTSKHCARVEHCTFAIQINKLCFLFLVVGPFSHVQCQVSVTKLKVHLSVPSPKDAEDNYFRSREVSSILLLQLALLVMQDGNWRAQRFFHYISYAIKVCCPEKIFGSRKKSLFALNKCYFTSI